MSRRARFVAHGSRIHRGRDDITESTQDPAASAPAAGSGKVFLGRLLLFVGAWFFLLAAQEGCYQKASKIVGIVIEKGHKTGTSGVGHGSTGTRSYYWVRYRFATPEGEAKEHTDTEVLPGTWNELREGGPVDVEYMPSLADSRVAGQKAASSTYALIAVVLLAAGVVTLRSGQRPGLSAG